MRTASLIGMVMAAAARSGVTPDLSFLKNRRNPKGHDWGGKRHKLKKYSQDHQRPRRRRV